MLRGRACKRRVSKGEGARNAAAGLNAPIRPRESGVTSAEEAGMLRRNAGRRRTALKAAQKKIRCYNCWEEGHTIINCQECCICTKNRTHKPVTVGLHRWKVGRYTDDIHLDTGCARTMVRNKEPSTTKNCVGTQ